LAANQAARHVPEKHVRKEIASAVRTLFDTGMKGKLGPFRLFKDKGNRQIKPGTQVYRWEKAPDMYFFVMLETQTKEPDRFWVSVAWSRDGFVPSIYPDLGGVEGDRFNLGKLSNARNSFHEWELTKLPSVVDMSPEEMSDEISKEWDRKRIAEGIRQAPASVADAIDRIVEYAVPYFERVSQTH
jgi:hypothetical protein